MQFLGGGGDVVASKLQKRGYKAIIPLKPIRNTSKEERRGEVGWGHGWTTCNVKYTGVDAPITPSLVWSRCPHHSITPSIPSLTESTVLT